MVHCNNDVAMHKNLSASGALASLSDGFVGRTADHLAECLALLRSRGQLATEEFLLKGGDLAGRPRLNEAFGEIKRRGDILFDHGEGFPRNVGGRFTDGFA